MAIQRSIVLMIFSPTPPLAPFYFQSSFICWHQRLIFSIKFFLICSSLEPKRNLISWFSLLNFINSLLILPHFLDDISSFMITWERRRGGKIAQRTSEYDLHVGDSGLIPGLSWSHEHFQEPSNVPGIASASKIDRVEMMIRAWMVGFIPFVHRCIDISGSWTV